jgi:hypothetical protein
MYTGFSRVGGRLFPVETEKMRATLAGRAAGLGRRARWWAVGAAETKWASWGVAGGGALLSGVRWGCEASGRWRASSARAAVGSEAERGVLHSSVDWGVDAGHGGGCWWQAVLRGRGAVREE